jgi:hypothetical protein
VTRGRASGDPERAGKTAHEVARTCITQYVSQSWVNARAPAKRAREASCLHVSMQVIERSS